MSDIRQMPVDFFPEIRTKQEDDGTWIRTLYYRDRAIVCVDGITRNVELGVGYKMENGGMADPEKDRALRLSVWQATELVRTHQESGLSAMGIVPFECSEEEECTS